MPAMAPFDGPSAGSRNWPELGILDFLPVGPAEDPASTLRATIDTAVLADRLGFRRYWIAEHWASGVATPSPEVLAPVIAGLTGRILVGPAGVLLRFYSPLKVAANALLAEAVFPGRTELGLARGGASPDVARALRATGDQAIADAAAPPYDDKVAEVQAYLEDRGPVSAYLRAVAPPELWILGTGGDSASLAARLGASFALSLFHRPTMPDPVAVDRAYRDAFRPSSLRGAPRTCIAIAGACSDTDTDARRIAAAYPNIFVWPTIVGTPDHWANELGSLARRFAADDVVVLDLSQRLEDRFRTLELLARTFGDAKPAHAGSRRVRQPAPGTGDR